MTCISRMINVVNLKFVAANNCSEIEFELTECHARSRKALLSSREKSQRKKKLQKVSSKFQEPNSEDEVHRPTCRVSAGARKSLGMQF